MGEYITDQDIINSLKQENDMLKIKLMNALNDLAVWKASEKRLRREMENNE